MVTEGGRPSHLVTVHAHGSAWARDRAPDRIRIDWRADVAEVGRDHWGSRKERNATPTELELLGRTVDELTLAHEAAGEPWGLIHGDFRAHNCVRDGERIKPIDFDLCALSYQLDDVGWFLADVEDADMRRAFMDGYARTAFPLPDLVRLAEGALIAARVRRCAWGGAFPEQVIQECERYLTGTPFLYGGG